MKLIKCEVYAFGKLKNFEYDFTDGLNTIKQDNGWGKSTLASFIKAMFYGISGSKRDIEGNERKKYRPWNSTDMFGGSVSFLWRDKEYRIERFFGKKESEDTVKLFDVNTGKQFQNTENLGARIFQIDEEGFFSTTYFSQKDLEVKSNTSLTAKFNEVSDTQDSEMFDTAVAKLLKEKNNYQYSGNRGYIPDTKRAIFDVAEKIECAKAYREDIAKAKEISKELEQKNEILRKRSDELMKKIDEASKERAMSVKRAQYQKLVRERDENFAAKEKIVKNFNGNIPKENDITSIETCIADLNKTIEHKKILEKDILSLEDGQKIEQNGIEKNKKKKIPFFIVCALFFVIGIVCCVIPNVILSICAFVVSLLFGALAIYFAGQSKPKDGINAELLKNKKTELAGYSDIEKSYKQNIGDFFVKYNVSRSDDYAVSLNNIKKNIDTTKHIDERIFALNKEISECEKDKSIFNTSLNQESIENLSATLRYTQVDYKKNEQMLALKLSDIKRLEVETDNLSDYENRYLELTEQQKKYEYELDIISTTFNFLKQADETLKVKYRKPLRDSLNKYLSKIASGISADIDIDLNVTIEENGVNRETDYYSKGFKNLFEICKRFALTDVLFTTEKPFMILDDPFYNLDDEKIIQALKLVEKLSSEYQILYFVCHKSRVLEE